MLLQKDSYLSAAEKYFEKSSSGRHISYSLILSAEILGSNFPTIETHLGSFIKRKIVVP